DGLRGVDEDGVRDGPGAEVGGVEAGAHVVEADAGIAGGARVEAALGGGLVACRAVGVGVEACSHLPGAGGLREEGAALVVEEVRVGVAGPADGAILDGGRTVLGLAAADGGEGGTDRESDDHPAAGERGYGPESGKGPGG